MNNCPEAGIVVTPQFVAPGLTTITVLSLNNLTGCAVLDGSQSSDANGNTLTFRWRADGVAAVIATGARATNCFSLGAHTITLAVNDSSCTNQASVSVEVITAGEATELLVAEVNATPLNLRVQRSLAAALKSAGASFDRGQVDAGLAQLVAYQNKVRVLVPVGNVALSTQLIRSAQNLIDAIRAAQAL